MFAIGGNMHVSTYKDTKYEPLEIIMEAQEEVGVCSPPERSSVCVRGI